MKHLGDITKINGSEVPPVDVIIGGSPCQDLSVAGKRAGLAGERSGLFMEQIRIIKEMRSADEQRNGTAHVRPRYMVWENVPGAFSSNKGQDFRAVLEETARIVEKELPDIPIPSEGWHYSGMLVGEGWSVAWRIFDAQFWGVPQRRRRIALVADFGGYTAPEILFERKSVRGYTPPSRTPWKDFAAAVAERFGGADKARENSELAYCIQGNCIDRADTAGCNGKGWTENVSYTLNTVDRPAVYDARDNGDGQIAPTMTGDHNGHISDYTTLCVRERCGCEGGGKGLLVQEEKSGTLAANNDQFVAQTPKHNIINATSGSFMNFDDKGLAFTLIATNCKRPQYVCLNSFDCQSKRVFDTSGVAPTLDLNGGSPACNQGGMAVIQSINGDIAGTLDASYYKGCGERQGIEREVVCVGNGQLAQARISNKIGALNCMHDQQAILISTKGNDNAETRNQILRLLQETYGEKTIFKWGIAILERLQQTDILQQGVHESGIQSETENRQKLDDSALPCPSVVTEWLLRDMRQREECGCSPQGRKSTEQRFEQSDESMPELSQQNSQTCKDLFDMWEKGKRLGVLRQTLSEIQEVWQSFNGKGQSVHGCSIVRRLTPLEAERLQGFPSGWTDIGDYIDTNGKKRKTSDTARYKALGNSIALPSWVWVLERLSSYCGDKPTMASLFDGIGGFPLIWETLNGKGTCLWASEIEEFPIAVTKYHFT